MDDSLSLILYLIRQFAGERSLSGIYHVLRGKPSAQPQQDSFLFGVRRFFHVFDQLERQAFNAWIARLDKQQAIKPLHDESDRFVITETGEAAYAQWQSRHSFPDGLLYTHHIQEEQLFWQKLQLLTQTLSELSGGERAFVPVTRSAQAAEYVRLYVHHFQRQYALPALAARFCRQLSAHLQSLPMLEANILVAQLSGYRSGGMTTAQIASALTLDPVRVQLLFKSALRTLMHRIELASADAPDLVGMIKIESSGLSHSAERTLHILQHGLSIEELATRRQLKRGTIEDHLVEIVLKVDAFDVSCYLSDKEQRLILEAARELKTKELRVLKHRLGHRFTFFQIRLALALQAVAERNFADG
ncbi:MAG: helix-turn-helix domain-containing protein [Sporolactobacillus sp.]